MLGASRSPASLTRGARRGRIGRHGRSLRRRHGWFLLSAWYEANSGLPDPLDPPRVEATWVELRPSPDASAIDYAELQRTDEWLTLAQVLDRHDPHTLEALGFPQREQATLKRLNGVLARLYGYSDLRPLVEQVTARVRHLAPEYATDAAATHQPTASAGEVDWWVPEDIALPPTTERVTAGPPTFTIADVHRVLRDL